MGKFDGILLCTDLDGTLLNSKSEISQKNIDAIEYFKAEGGKFTIVTGRMPRGALYMAERAVPNFPAVVYNGSGIYDFEKNEILWSIFLDSEAEKVVDMVLEQIDDVGVVVAAADCQYFCVNSSMTDAFYKLTKYEKVMHIPYKEISEPWKKVLFVTTPETIEKIRKLIKDSPFSDSFNYVRSNTFLFELLPHKITKAVALSKLLEIKKGVKKVVSVGDGENDIDMLKFADVGIAVGNAMDVVKQSADTVTVTNDEDAIAQIIHDIENGII